MIGFTPRIDLTESLLRRAVAREPRVDDGGSPHAAGASSPVTHAAVSREDLATARHADTFGGASPVLHAYTPPGGAEPASLAELTAEADTLRSRIDAAQQAREFAAVGPLWRELAGIEASIERTSLGVLEQYLEEDENAKDGVLSTKDLEALATDTSLDEDVRLAARFFVDNPSRRDALDTANDPGGRPDGRISLGDIHARRLELEDDIANIEEAPGDDSYDLPDGDRSVTGLGSPEKGQALFDAQQDAIEEAIRTGETVAFENANGDVVDVTVARGTGGDRATYAVTVGEDSFDVESEIALGDTIAGIANIVDWGSALDAADGIRRYPDLVLFEKAPKVRVEDGTTYTTRASYNGDHRLTYRGGDEHYLDKELYHHELGHGIGRDLDDNRVPWTNDASPADWPAIHESTVADGTAISDYSETNDRESFAEAFAAYVNARDHGPEALAEFREAYPEQTAYIDEHVFGIVDVPS